jgi:hypothetical protein
MIRAFRHFVKFPPASSARTYVTADVLRSRTVFFTRLLRLTATILPAFLGLGEISKRTTPDCLSDAPMRTLNVRFLAVAADADLPTNARSRVADSTFGAVSSRMMSSLYV